MRATSAARSKRWCKARNAALTAQGPAQVAAAENQLTGALRGLLALSEAYPDLKANTNFQQLQTELSDIENKLAAARRFFNNAVQEYNTGIEQLPAALFAGSLGFRRKRVLRPRRDPRPGRTGAQREVLNGRCSRNSLRGASRHMAAYGLYTHIASNKTRSILLLIGLFLLIYVIVFAGAICPRGVPRPGPLGRLLSARGLVRSSRWRFRSRRRGRAVWIVIAYFFNQSIIDAVTGGHEVTRKEAAAALQSARKPLHLARHSDAEAEGDGHRRAECVRERPQPAPVFGDGHHADC